MRELTRPASCRMTSSLMLGFSAERGDERMAGVVKPVRDARLGFRGIEAAFVAPRSHRAGGINAAQIGLAGLVFEARTMRGEYEMLGLGFGEAGKPEAQGAAEPTR